MFVNEMKYFVENGYEHKSKIYDVKFHGLICDSPAKAFVLKVTGHGGYSSFTKCVIEGKYNNRRVCFPGERKPSKTDKDFLEKTDEDYHTGVSISTKALDRLLMFLWIICMLFVWALCLK